MRFLPPLLLGLVLALIAVRCALEPHREEAMAHIDGLAQGGDNVGAAKALERFEKRYDTVADRWYAAETWLRIRQPVRAIDTIWKDPEISARPDSARRFAESALFTLGWENQARTDATTLEPLVILALVEGGSAWAEERLTQYGRELPLMGVTPYFFPAYRATSRAPLARLVAAFRERHDEKFDVAAAMGGLLETEYAGKAADVATLLDVIASDAWRRQYRDVWHVSALALGRAGTPEAVEALQAAVARFEDSTNEGDRHDLDYVRNGLLAAGHMEVDAALAPIVFAKAPNLKLMVWYVEALIHRYRLGDARVEPRMQQLWEGPGVRFPGIRWRIARALLLGEKPPNDTEVKMFVGRMVRELEAPGSLPLGHVLANAWRLRAREPGAREGLLGVLRDAAKAFTAGQMDAEDLAEPFIEALRALYLYG